MAVYPHVSIYKRELKEALPDMRTILETYGFIDRTKGGRITCPKPEHDDKDPSVQVKKDICICYACNGGDAEKNRGGFFDAFDIAKFRYPELKSISDLGQQLAADFDIPLEQVSNISELEARKTNKNIFTEHFPLDDGELSSIGLGATYESREAPPKYNRDIRAEIEEAQKHIGETDYHRGLSDETLKHFKVGFSPKWDYPREKGEYWTPSGYPRIIIPIGEDKYIARLAVSLKDKKTEKNIKCMRVGSSPLFNKDAMYEGKPFFVCEGEIDAMSFYEIGAKAVGLGGVSGVNALVLELQQNRPKFPVIIALDNDEIKSDGEQGAGQSARDKLIHQLEKLRIPYISNDNLYGQYKDANEALCEDRAGFVQRVQETYLQAFRMANKMQIIPDEIQKAAAEIYKPVQRLASSVTPMPVEWRSKQESSKKTVFKNRFAVEKKIVQQIDDRMEIFKTAKDTCENMKSKLQEGHDSDYWKQAFDKLHDYNQFVMKHPREKMPMSSADKTDIRNAVLYETLKDYISDASKELRYLSEMRKKVVKTVLRRKDYIKSLTDKE